MIVDSHSSSFFPYPFIRPQQHQIIQFIVECLDSKQIGVIEAATGVGKTIAALSPLLDYIYEYNTQNSSNPLKLVVLGRTHSQADRVMEELSRIQKKTGMSVRAVSKQGKQSLCIHEEVKDSKSGQFTAICSAYKKNKKCGFFVNSLIPSKTEFVAPLLEAPLTATELKHQSILHKCCPAEISNQVLKSVDVISASYHYLFSNDIRERFLQSLDIDGQLSRLILLVDECHNLPSATIQMNTIKLSSTQLDNAEIELRRSKIDEDYRSLQSYYIEVIHALQTVLSNIIEETRLGPLELLHSIEHNVKGGDQIRHEIVEDLKLLSGLIAKVMVTRYYIYLDHIVDFFELLFKLLSRRDSLILVYPQGERKYIELKVMDPSSDISWLFRQVHTGFLMTGTLGQAQIYRAQVGLYQSTSVLQLPSPYEQELAVFTVPYLTSKYSERGPQMYQAYVNTITSICESDVNIGLYVTSYSFLDKLFEYGLDKIGIPIYRAEKTMNSAETEELLHEFRRASSRGGGLLCSVMGGRSSEGTDFPGDEMEIVIIAGLPYPPQTQEQKAILEYYRQRTKAAWDIVYATPAMRQINQAAGRAVRSLQDRAVIFLLDHRINRHKSKLTGWLQSSLVEISSEKIGETLGSYFT